MRHFSDCEACVEAILARLGKRIVLGIPLGIGKPNAMVNALYQRVKADPSIRLDIITALSLNPPRGATALEERFLQPLRTRIWGDYPRLDYLDDLEAGRLPAHIRVIQFYLRAGSGLRRAQVQQDYISSNYTHVARDMLLRGVNLLMQAVAVHDDDGQRRYSLSSNPDITLQILPMIRASHREVMVVAQVNRGLPWLGNAAEIGENAFDTIVDHPQLDHVPFSVPHDPVGTADWAIGLRASRLVRDGGTLQVGIGALGDAVCHALRLRESDNTGYRAALQALGDEALSEGAPGDGIGGVGPFASGLYVASELISHALFSLFEAGIVRRRVYENESVQRLAWQNPQVAAQRGRGTTMQGAFFIGPAEFYRKLHALPEAQRTLIDMTSVAEVNRIYTHYTLEHLQRRHARFINITMRATLLGAAVSDQLADGQVVSGVGGQSDFVSMAHQLPDGRSILLLRATFERNGRVESNIVWEYPHATIPRHMRDIFVSEYGIADLRGKTDRECIEAMLAIADSRFQPQLLRQAQRAGKLPAGYRIPAAAQNNTPQRIAAALRPHQTRGALPLLPFGCDLSDAELALARRLKKLQAAAQAGWSGRWALLRALSARSGADTPEVAAALAHLRLQEPKTTGTRWLARLVRAAYRL